jgi:hypothetical protein
MTFSLLSLIVLVLKIGHLGPVDERQIGPSNRPRNIHSTRASVSKLRVSLIISELDLVLLIVNPSSILPCRKLENDNTTTMPAISMDVNIERSDIQSPAPDG